MEAAPVDMETRPCLSIKPYTAVRKNDPMTFDEHGKKPNGSTQTTLESIILSFVYYASRSAQQICIPVSVHHAVSF